MFKQRLDTKTEYDVKHPDENTDDDLLKTREKLAIKMANVQAAEDRLKQKIKQVKEKTV